MIAAYYLTAWFAVFLIIDGEIIAFSLEIRLLTFLLIVGALTTFLLDWWL